MRILVPKLFLLVFISCAQSQTLNYYFGNIHAHTAFSDGNKDSLSSGVSKPDGSYAYAKLSDDFDFLGISEHNHYSVIRNPGFKLPRYQMGLGMANAATENEKFLALYGMEYGVSSTYNGHVIIYGSDELFGWENSVPGVTGNNYDVYNSKTDYDGLFKKIAARPKIFGYLAHPYWTDFTTDGTGNTALAFSEYNATFDSAIVGLPLRSGNAFSMFSDYSDYPSGDYFNYFKKLLYLGYHLGIGYDHDNHYTNFGRSNGGRLVVLSPALNASAFFEAMHHMHFYGSDDANAKIDFKVNDNIMGSIAGGNSYPKISVIHEDPDGEKADTIRIWKGYKNSGGLWAWVIQSEVGTNVSALTDYSVSPGIEYYYFAEIRQKDGQWMVCSPVWYTPGYELGVAENLGAAEWAVCSMPADKLVLITSRSNIPYRLRLLDLSGRIMYENPMVTGDLKIDTTHLESGIYLVELQSSTAQRSTRVMMD